MNKKLMYKIQAFPFPNEHAARVVSPKGFERFARKNIAPGIDIILGIRGGKSTTQAYRFKKSRFTAAEARTWLKEHNVKVILFEPAGATQAFESNVCLLTKRLQAFAKERIIDIIGKDKLEEIKKTDEHPFFQAYSLCHEGVSTPRIIGEQARPIQWSRAAIQSIKNVIKKGIKFFKGHNSDSSTENRKSIGELVGSAEEEIDGKLHHLVIAYHPEEVREEAKNYDICSQESIWDFIEAGKNLIADTMKDLTSIALGNSDFEKPAFSEAKRLGAIQAFSDTTAEEDSVPPAGNVDDTKNKGDYMNLKDVKNAIEELGLFPNQVFSNEKLMEDREYLKLKESKEELEKQLKEKEDAFADEKKTLEEKSSKLEKEAGLGKASGVISKLVKEIPDMTDEERRYVNNSFDKNKDSIEDFTDDGLKKFIDSQRGVFKDVTSSIKNEPDVEFKTGDGLGGEDKDYTKQENNPLLKEDFNKED